jgi:hypothetical protein
MTLNHRCLGEICDARQLMATANEELVAFWTRNEKRRPLAIGVNADRADDSPDRITVAQRTR